MNSRDRDLRELFKHAMLVFSFDGLSSEPKGELDAAALMAVADLAAERAVRLYAETHPRPTQVSQTQAAEMLGVHPKTVRNYIVAGSLRLNGCGQIPIEAVDRIRSVA